MKRTLAGFLVAILLVLALPLFAGHAEDEVFTDKSGKWKYRLVDGGAIISRNKDKDKPTVGYIADIYNYHRDTSHDRPCYGAGRTRQCNF